MFVKIYKNILGEKFMENILIHGLGQNEKSYGEVIKELHKNNIQVKCPNLFNLVKEEKLNYKNLYKAFSTYCNEKTGMLNLCGLSLGGILALDYAKENPDKVNSLIIMGTPCKISKMLFKLQKLIFKVMPQKTFEKIGCRKQDFISLVKSMENLEIDKNLNKISSNTLILCGENDKANLEQSKRLNEKIKTSELEIVENSSHEINIDNPTELARIITKFWEE